METLLVSVFRHAASHDLTSALHVGTQDDKLKNTRRVLRISARHA